MDAVLARLDRYVEFPQQATLSDAAVSGWGCPKNALNRFQKWKLVSVTNRINDIGVGFGGATDQLGQWKARSSCAHSRIPVVQATRRFSGSAA